MNLSPELVALANYLAGEFDNQEQASSEPVWYVHLRLWQRPIPPLWSDSLALFAEQSNILNLDQPYRQRIMRVMQGGDEQALLQVQYYMFKDPSVFSGSGSNPALLNALTIDQLELLPGCVLNVTYQQTAFNSYLFTATPDAQQKCCFTYRGNTIQVSLGFEVAPKEFKSFDKGIDPTTGNALWGAMMGPYCYTKRQQYQGLEFC
jgi:CpeT/CpcT family (DUF1001)